MFFEFIEAKIDLLSKSIFVSFFCILKITCKLSVFLIKIKDEENFLAFSM